MVGIAHSGSNGLQQGQHHGDGGQRREGKHPQRSGVDALWLLAFAAHKAEEGGLHAKRQQDNEDGDVGIDIGDDSILAARGSKTGRLNGHQQVVDESGNDARQTVDGRVLGQ